MKEFVKSNIVESRVMKVDNFEKKYKDYTSALKQNLNIKETKQKIIIIEVKDLKKQKQSKKNH